MHSPEVDGFSLLAAIEQDPATRHTPVLGLSTGGGAGPAPGHTAPLVATAMAGGVVAAALAGDTGWATLAPLLGARSAARTDEP
jgi:CheY-like chemotaxis protein